jgi:hypothetical protein
MNTTIYKNKPEIYIKYYFCPNFRKMKKGIENRNQRVTIFFLVCLSDIDHRKIVWNPGLVLICNTPVLPRVSLVPQLVTIITCGSNGA